MNDTRPSRLRTGIAVLLLLSAGCTGETGRADSEAQACPGLAKLDPAHAAADAAAAGRRGDRHLLEVNGYTSWVPGVGSPTAGTPPEANDHPLVNLAETSDATPCPALNARAVAYAEAYNKAILAQGTR